MIQNLETASSVPTVPGIRKAAILMIVLGDQVLVCDGSRVLAYNLNDRPDGPDGSEGRPVSPAWAAPAWRCGPIRPARS